MNRIKMAFAVLAAAITIATSAFTFADSPKAPALEDPLYWYTSSGVYTNRHQVKSQEIISSGCPDQSTVVCERGYGPEDFNTFNNPQSGLKSTAQPNALIMRALP